MAAEPISGNGAAFFERRLGAWKRALLVGALLLAVQLPMEFRYEGWPASAPLRIVWVGLLLFAAWIIRPDRPRLARAAAYIVGLTSGILAAAIIAVTGGALGPRFGYLLAFPLILAVLLPDVPWAAAAMGLGTLAGGLVILSAQQDAWFIAEWAALSVVATGLAVYGTVTSRRVLGSELQLQAAHAEALVRLAEAERASAVGRMAAAVAHHVSNPLAVVKANVDYLKQSLTGGGHDPDVRQAIVETIECTDRIAQLLAVLRGLSPASPDLFQCCALHALVAEASSLASVGDGDAEFQVEPGLPPVWVVQRGMIVALVGLLSETRRAAAARRGTDSPQGGPTLLVSAWKEAGHVSLLISERPVAARPAPPSTSATEDLATNLAPFGELVKRSGASFRVSVTPEGGAELEILAPIASEHAGDDHQTQAEEGHAVP